MRRIIAPLRAEVRLAVQPAAVLTVLLAVAAAVRAVVSYLDGVQHGPNGLDASITALATPAGALQAAAWHHSSLLGLVFVAVLCGVVLAEGLESGTWPLVRLYQGRVWLLVLRKIVVVLLLAVLSMAVTAVALWAAFKVGHSVEPPGGSRPEDVPTAVPSWGEALTTCARALLVLTFFTALAACGAAVARAVIAAAVLGAGPLVVTLPLVTTELRVWVPHYWIAAWMKLPEGAQWSLYWWSSTPGAPDTGTALTVLSTLSCCLLLVSWLSLRTERSLSPRA
ncbi:hypothetical protein [Streptomyces azureus]|uniref:Transporter n=1 Tax=Streptomyces azureus TaxID=146537 RepID=A0A0K8PX28_STRAJ|nr:hypothetical protein [Streptomyces azureus]GAP52366.1 transporter [Streptomyces azureus]